MTNYAVLGAGIIGEAIIYDLLENTSDSSIYVYEANETRIQYINNRFKSNSLHVKPFKLDMSVSVEKSELYHEFIKNNINIAFGAIDYKFNEYLTDLCITTGTHFLDLGGNPEVVRKQKLMNDRAKEKEVTIIPDCGLAPGMVNIVAVHVMNEFDKLDSCHIRVGGLPQNPHTILNYQQVFSIRGLTNEYLEDAFVIRDGKIQTVPSLTEVEELYFPKPFGRLEAFQTSGGTSNLPELYAGKINELTYKTIRYPGHVQFIQFLKEFGFLSSKPTDICDNPRELTEYLLQYHLPKGEPDVVLARITVCGEKDNKFLQKIYTLIDKYDDKTKLSSMARTTAFPISILGIMIANGDISKKGVVAGEEVAPKMQFMNELAKRNIIFNENIIE